MRTLVILFHQEQWGSKKGVEPRTETRWVWPANICPSLSTGLHVAVRWWSESESHSAISYSLRPYGLYSPWNSPGKNIGVGSLSLLQEIFPTQGWNSSLLHCRGILYQLSYQVYLTSPIRLTHFSTSRPWDFLTICLGNIPWVGSPSSSALLNPHPSAVILSPFLILS